MMDRKNQHGIGAGFPPCRWAAVLILAWGSLIGGNGCAPKSRADGSTPESAWKAFDRRMQKGDLRGAASCFAYSRWAEQQNPDWSTFAPTQRKLVVDKLQEDCENALKQWSYPPGGCSVQQVQTQGTEALLIVGGGGRSFQVTMVQTEGQWKILSGVPPQPGF
jgi:hypothetical protein